VRTPGYRPFAQAGFPRRRRYYRLLRRPLGASPLHGATAYKRCQLPGTAGSAALQPLMFPGRDGPPQLTGQPSDRSTPLTPEGPSTPAPGSQTPSMAFAAAATARLPLGPTRRRVISRRLLRLHCTLQTGQSLHPASHPASRPRTGVSLPGTQASPRTGLPPAGSPALTARLRHRQPPSLPLAPKPLGARSGYPKRAGRAIPLGSAFRSGPRW
jgi:hypothetical protein